MAIDIGQFVQTFFEESLEGLDITETSLLALSPGAADMDQIGTIFRAIHSIKGGSGTFGFQELTAFAHIMETLLDKVRQGQLPVTIEAVNALLESVDCLREMLVAVRAKDPVDDVRIAPLAAQLTALLQGSGGGAAAAPAPKAAAPVAASSASSGPAGWRIEFLPNQDMMHSGNDPVRMFRELSSLGKLTAQCDTSHLPVHLADMKPEDCFLSWELEIVTPAPRADLLDVFAWVEDDCTLTVTSLSGGDAPSQPEPVVAAPAAKPAPVAAMPVVAAPVPAEDGQQGELMDRRKPSDRRLNDRRGPAPAPDSVSIRVSIDKVDAVINLVGELVTTQSMLSVLGAEFDMSKMDKLHEALDQLDRNTRDLQDHVMRIRMMPVSSVFSRFPRMVHDLSAKLGKQIELRISGEQTELDKTVIEKIGDPLVHLVRNSLDHGLEPADERIKNGKSPVGIATLNAYHKSGSIFIEVGDDGRGLNRDALLKKGLDTGLLKPNEEYTDEQIYELIFHPGLSTAEQISDVSGRGVGMDVVRRNIQDVGGSIQIGSQRGKGTMITISLPLTLAILDGQLVSLGEDCYIIPLLSIIESVQPRAGSVNRVAGRGEVLKFRGQHLPILRLNQLFGTEGAITDLEKGLLVVVEADGRQVGLFVDDLLGQQQVSIKSMEKNFRRVAGIAGATILGDGRVGLILDISGLVRVNT